MLKEKGIWNVNPTPPKKKIKTKQKIQAIKTLGIILGSYTSKDLLYGELDHGLRPVGRPKLRFKDTCKRDMIEIGLDVENWEMLAADRGRWRINCSACLDEGELRIRKEAMARRERRKAALNAPPASVFVCSGCSRVCSSRIGLFSHQSRCRNMR